uniref:Ankyrin repeat-containing protein At3g12360 family n=1 Tax=Cajanus cajan TaxID=3821 RepID=A0A151R9Q7_CAJCA|nr:Ankyrin repeat-containing protein At3g12360 family [Cajanus cajan]
MKGKWKEVTGILLEENKALCRMKINKSRGTVLHVAVNEGKEEVVKSVVKAITEHDMSKAFESRNERGDTPLHLAATRGFKNMCELIIGENNERKHLVEIHNNEGETPLFHAALSWQKETFVYLCSLMPQDLALIIMHKYPELNDVQNREGFSPLKLLATRPSAFKSGSNLRWWKTILYHCIFAETLNVEKAEEMYKKVDEPDQNNQFPRNYDTCYQLYDQFLKLIKELVLQVRHLAEVMNSLLNKLGNKKVEREAQQKHQQCQISMPEDSVHEVVPPNCVTCLQFVRLAYIYTLGLSGVGVENIKKMKQKHVWSNQLLKEFMKNPNEMYMGSGGPPPSDVSTFKPDFISFNKEFMNNLYEMYMGSGSPPPSDVGTSETDFISFNKEDTDPKEKTVAANIDTEETVILVAAKNGITEMVNELIDKIPSSVHETTSNKKNVLHVAVENRQTHYPTTKLWDNLIIGVDDQENTVLHMAASRTNKGWMISGAALQMMWHIKWFQYIKGLAPEHFTIRTNKAEKIAGEIFKDSHKLLVKDASEWLKDTSESCSVVAALLAGVSFATSTTVPGGVNTDTGDPALKGRPAFQAFALFSLMGLCFSVTALVMFLSILTSRKEIKDFRTSLPVKLLLGLSSLFLSITALFATFCSGHFFVIDDKYKQILILIYAVTCMPVTFYAIAQFPLYVDLVRAITTKVPLASDKSTDYL